MHSTVTRVIGDPSCGSAAESRENGAKPRATVLITGIGCVGKSMLRRRVAEALGGRVVTVDRDDAAADPPVAPHQVLVVESVHGLEQPPETWDLVVYLLPPPGHALRWLGRGLAWLRTGRVDRPPRAVRRPWSLLNLPLIVRLVARNIWNARRWVRGDLDVLETKFGGSEVVTGDAADGLLAIERAAIGTQEGRGHE